MGTKRRKRKEKEKEKEKKKRKKVHLLLRKDGAMDTVARPAANSMISMRGNDRCFTPKGARTSTSATTATHDQLEEHERSGALSRSRRISLSRRAVPPPRPARDLVHCIP